MAIWLILALMTGAAVMAVLWPLSRRKPAAPGGEIRSATETRFYRDQLAEIERDMARGLLSGPEAEAARAEAGRRLLRAVAAPPAPGGADPAVVGEPALRRRRAASALALSTVPLIALVVYGAHGSPELPAQPLAARLQTDPKALDLATAVARVESILAQNPQDGRGWEVIAPVYLRSGRFDDAVRAYDSAIRYLGESAPRLTSYGEALVAARRGVVSEEARSAFQRALKLDAADPKAQFYLAQGAEQDGDVAEARSRYGALMAGSPPNAPWLALVRERLARLDAPKVDPDAAGAVASLPAGDRETAIRGMVAGLADRLEQKGGTPEEWTRLVRSYLVLGERDKARAALDKARQALGASGGDVAALDALAREAGDPTASAAVDAKR